MKRPEQPYGWAAVTAEDWRALGAVLADTDPRPLDGSVVVQGVVHYPRPSVEIAALFDTDPRPLDERTPRPAAPLAFLVLAAVGVIAPLWALIVIIGA